ncbi:uncharacterized protein EDB93DRAFT_1109316 [Suillus bovinus]|uniref:uncharacterized protein n=1 Tax=Suillus bovinus TaxID=48563 RepID=UPI001B868777|nr:uncharacterized protein EDB93DRAFT_1109316 [Suillus bovinus]KAG2127302.1 hypothetical protein EDB93DRAFT_1109316 [Suillus bovinus]
MGSCVIKDEPSSSGGLQFPEDLDYPLFNQPDEEDHSDLALEAAQAKRRSLSAYHIHTRKKGKFICYGHRAIALAHKHNWDAVLEDTNQYSALVISSADQSTFSFSLPSPALVHCLYSSEPQSAVADVCWAFAHGVRGVGNNMVELGHQFQAIQHVGRGLHGPKPRLWDGLGSWLRLEICLKLNLRWGRAWSSCWELRTVDEGYLYCQGLQWISQKAIVPVVSRGRVTVLRLCASFVGGAAINTYSSALAGFWVEVGL